MTRTDEPARSVQLVGRKDAVAHRGPHKVIDRITTQKLFMAQKQATPDFLDRKHERRRLFAEAWGTFLLLLVARGGGVVTARAASPSAWPCSWLRPG